MVDESVGSSIKPQDAKLTVAWVRRALNVYRKIQGNEQVEVSGVVYRDSRTERRGVMKLIPHRWGALLLHQVDRESFVPGKELIGIHFIPRSWFRLSSFLRGHLPGRPVYPGVFYTELAAQTGLAMANLTILAQGERPVNVGFYLTGYSAEIEEPVFVGTKKTGNKVIIIKVIVAKYRLRTYKFEWTAMCDGRLVAQGKFTGMQPK